MIIKELVAKLGLEVDEGAFKVGEKVLHALHSGAAAFAGIAVASGIALLGMVKATANAGDEAKKLAQRVGVDSEVLQGLGYAAELSEISTEKLAAGLQHLAKTGVKDVNVEMLRLADRFKDMPDGAEKTRIAMEKFGRGVGPRFISMLNGGSKELAALTEEAREFGLVISKDDQDAAENFNDQITRLGKVFVGFRGKITMGLIRPLTEAIITFRKASLVALNSIASWLNKTENVQFVLYLVATAFAASAAAAASAAVAWLLAAAPFIALAAVVLLAAIAIQDLVMYLGNDGETAIGRFVKFYTSQFTGLRDFISTVFAFLDSLVDGFFTTNMKRLQNFLKPVSDFVTGNKGALDQKSLVQGFAGADAKYGPSGELISGAVYKSPTAAAAGASSSVTAPVTINVTAAPGMNEETLASKVAEHVKTVIRQTTVGFL